VDRLFSLHHLLYLICLRLNLHRMSLFYSSYLQVQIRAQNFKNLLNKSLEEQAIMKLQWEEDKTKLQLRLLSKLLKKENGFA
jgi:hypothetical protein